MVSAKSSGKNTVELKTKPGKADVGEFVGAIDDAKKRGDAERLIAMMKEISGEDPVMWGSSIIARSSKGSPQPRAGRRTRR